MPAERVWDEPPTPPQLFARRPIRRTEPVEEEQPFTRTDRRRRRGFDGATIVYLAALGAFLCLLVTAAAVYTAYTATQETLAARRRADAAEIQPATTPVGQRANQPARPVIPRVAADKEGQNWNVAELQSHLRSCGINVDSRKGGAVFGHSSTELFTNDSSDGGPLRVWKMPSTGDAHDTMGAMGGWAWGRFLFDKTNPKLLARIQAVLK